MRKFVLAIGSLIVHKLGWQATLLCRFARVRARARTRDGRYCRDTRYIESSSPACSRSNPREGCMESDYPRKGIA